MSDGTGSDLGSALGLLFFVAFVSVLYVVIQYGPGVYHRVRARRRQRRTQAAWEHVRREWGNHGGE